MNDPFTLRREDREGKSRFPLGMTTIKARATTRTKARATADPYGMTTQKGDGDSQAFSAGLQPAEGQAVEHLGRRPRLG